MTCKTQRNYNLPMSRRKPPPETSLLAGKRNTTPKKKEEQIGVKLHGFVEKKRDETKMRKLFGRGKTEW